mgnify:CR=1 FL=1
MNYSELERVGGAFRQPVVLILPGIIEIEIFPDPVEHAFRHALPHP